MPRIVAGLALYNVLQMVTFNVLCYLIKLNIINAYKHTQAEDFTMLDIKPKIAMLNGKKIKLFKVTHIRRSLFGSSPERRSPMVGTFDEQHQWHSYTLETGRSYQHEKGNKKIGVPKNIKSLITNLNKAKNNSASNGYSPSSYELEEVTDDDVAKYIEEHSQQ